MRRLARRACWRALVPGGRTLGGVDTRERSARPGVPHRKGKGVELLGQVRDGCRHRGGAQVPPVAASAAG